MLFYCYLEYEVISPTGKIFEFLFVVQGFGDAGFTSCYPRLDWTTIPLDPRFLCPWPPWALRLQIPEANAFLGMANLEQANGLGVRTSNSEVKTTQM